MPRSGKGWAGYHGTSLSAALSLLAGVELRLETALEQKIDGPPGFYLTDHSDIAVFFALRRAPGAVLRYSISAAATSALLSDGASINSIPQGRFPTEFPGRQLFVPPSGFPLFNRLRRAGKILVAPHGFG
jgi:hypothetical protein